MRAPARAASWTARLPTPPAPVVLVDAQHPRLPRIVVDDVRGGELATRHLIELGHERIAFVGDTSDPRYGVVASRLRCDGYHRATAAAGLPVRPELERTGPHGRRVAHRLTSELLAWPEPPTAIVAASDTQALCVLDAGRLRGDRRPGRAVGRRLRRSRRGGPRRADHRGPAPSTRAAGSGCSC
jgi:DNA-binding LacI/PurR family transcriptional regulator